MKRIISLILCAALLLLVPITVNADGDGNMDNGGGGGMGNGSDDSYWNGDDGVRVTIIRTSDNKPVSSPIDLTNYSENGIQFYFKKSKLQYKNGSRFQEYKGSYKFTIPSKALPKVITESGNANIAAIKQFFCSSASLEKIAQIIGTTYSQMTDGRYKLLLEPIAYFYFHGYKYAMTATEAALYDQALSGGLRAEMVSLTHQQLPLSMFLEHADLGYPAFQGNKSRPQSDSTIINQLGIGVVKFKDDGSMPPPSNSKVTYRTNTDVVTSVTLSSDDEISPDHPASVTFHIGGGNYTVTNIVIPADESQLVWCKWHTPSAPQTMDISVSASQGYLDIGSITASVVSVDGHEPPDPTANDRNDSFTAPAVPSPSTAASNTWGVWSGQWTPNPVWHEDWVWILDPASPTGGHWEDKGAWVDEGKWSYNFTSYRATLSANMNLEPGPRTPSAQGKHMRSGYGVAITVNGDLSTNAPQSHVTSPQTALSYFPEFQYKQYWRHLDCALSGTSASLMYKKNIYSTYGDRVHFTPLWYPDGKYTVYTYLEDAWTPAGMLSENLSDSTIIGGSVYDDWHIGPKMIE